MVKCPIIDDKLSETQVDLLRRIGDGRLVRLGQRQRFTIVNDRNIRPATAWRLFDTGMLVERVDPDQGKKWIVSKKGKKLLSQK